ncbi:MAG TPA: pyridoxal phosphate-dependent aminotransferase family protein [Saprospiraceae bacterium]|nr:pyridoxal phosphate-dependent aminotransferase family protein [Saprospiraceae bacterium]
MDIFDKMKDMGPLGKYANEAEGYYVYPNLEGPIGNRMLFRGKEVVMWSVNDYLGLANHPEVRKVDGEAARDWGMAYPMGSRLMSGNTVYHEQLEQDLAHFVQKESGFLVNFGYQGMVSAIDTLAGRDDVIVYDSESHACILDGMRLHPGQRYVFKHNDMESLEKNLVRAQNYLSNKKRSGGILVISEGVFGMRGDQGLLKEIVALKKDYSFRLLVDDAHGFGTLGDGGRGTGVEQGVQDGIDVYFATFAKSMAGIGAFFAADKQTIKYLKYNMRSQIYAKSLPMPMVIGAQKRLEMLKTMPELKNNLWRNVNNLQNGLKEKGFDIGNTNTCVTPVYMKGSVAEATQLVYDLRENYSIFCSVVVYPVVPKGMMILRLIPTANHTQEDIDLTLAAFGKVKDKLVAGEYKKVEKIIKVDA